jgi:hypothetical protein
MGADQTASTVAMTMVMVVAIGAVEEGAAEEERRRIIVVRRVIRRIVRGVRRDLGRRSGQRRQISRLDDPPAAVSLAADAPIGLLFLPVDDDGLRVFAAAVGGIRRRR